MGYNLKSSDSKVAARARKRMIESNLRLAASIARDIFWKNKTIRLELLDLTQEANIGLQKAVDKYDVTLGYKFSTYATWWIRQTVLRGIAEQAITIRVPVHTNESINKMNSARRHFIAQFGREPNEKELCDLLDTTIEKIQLLKRADQEILSLDTPVGEDDDSQLSDFIPSDCSTDVEAEKLVECAEIKQLMRKLLTERESFILCQRYGIGTERGLTLEEIGAKLNITRERVRQIETRALRKLKYHYYRQTTNNPESYSQYVLRKPKRYTEDD